MNPPYPGYSLTLPYSGYSWSFSHHVGTFSPYKLFQFLTIAHQARDYQDHQTFIRQQLSIANLFPPNTRSDSQKDEVWRDYQQFLAQVGLMYSTRYVSGKRPLLTELGLMYLDGTIGFSELFLTQISAYQYPNGHNTDLGRIKKKLIQNRIDNPRTRTELDVAYGVLIKPGILILQILLELYRQGLQSPLTTRQCFWALVPIKKNNDWLEGYSVLMRLQEVTNLKVEEKIRFIDEWFRLLKNSGFVVGRSRGIYLSQIAIDNIDQLQEIITFHSKPETFWIPNSYNKEIFRGWYEYFGSPTLERQWLMSEDIYDQNYLEKNYLMNALPSDELISNDIDPSSATDISETNISLRPFIAYIPEVGDVNEAINFAAVIRGRMRLRDKTRQHQEILMHLAARLSELSYNLADDPNSVDLLAEENGAETIFEVKTVNRRNFLPRIRLGIGQLSEYRYRRQLQTQARPNSILVLSNTLQLPAWTSSYLSSDVRIGLLYSTANSFIAFTNGLIEQEIQSSD